MSKYTVSICKLIDNGFDFGLDDYPIFDEAYREALNQDILDYYFMYEIGFETPALFRRYLRNRMNLIMPKYNAIYSAQAKLIKNPLGNMDFEESYSREATNAGSSTSSTNTSSKNLYQDTPQGNLDKTEMEDQTWATNLTQDKATANDNTTSNANSVETYTRTKIGSDGRTYSIDVYNKLINNFRSVNQMVIDELQDLFMGVL